MSLKFKIFNSDISCKIGLYTFFTINWNSLELRGQWGVNKSSWIRMYASISQKTKTVCKIASRNSTIIFLSNLFVTSCILQSSTKIFFFKGTSHWWFIGNFIWIYSMHMPDIFLLFFLSDSNIWYCFLYFMVNLIEAAFYPQMFLIVLIP